MNGAFLPRSGDAPAPRDGIANQRDASDNHCLGATLQALLATSPSRIPPHHISRLSARRIAGAYLYLRPGEIASQPPVVHCSAYLPRRKTLAHYHARATPATGNDKVAWA